MHLRTSLYMYTSLSLLYIYKREREQGCLKGVSVYISYVHVYRYIHIKIHICVYMCLYIYTYIYIDMYTYIYTCILAYLL